MKIDPIGLDYQASHALLSSAIVPRPIAFVSTVGDDGIFNLAPFSFFAPLCIKPPIVGFNVSSKRDGGRKDTIINIESTKEFVVNVVDEALAEPMNQSSDEYPSHIDEFREVGLTPETADLVKAPMVAESPVKMECRLLQILEFGEAPRKTSFVIGEVLRVHVKDELYADGEIKITTWKPVARLGAELYCPVSDIFEMKRPFAFS